jgi:hypothetical protein
VTVQQESIPAESREAEIPRITFTIRNTSLGPRNWGPGGGDFFNRLTAREAVVCERRDKPACSDTFASLPVVLLRSQIPWTLRTRVRKNQVTSGVFETNAVFKFVDHSDLIRLHSEIAVFTKRESAQCATPAVQYFSTTCSP